MLNYVNLNRRGFLRMSTVAGAGALGLSPSDFVSVDGAGESKMTVRVLGRTNIEVPTLGRGTMRADNPAALKAACNSGITHFDTAHGYRKNRNETMHSNLSFWASMIPCIEKTETKRCRESFGVKANNRKDT